ncbi:MAG TPA: hypothetical protein VK178_03295 [Opitutaceae bacterium]|nr:hypothetical protein [Opitutaceae bacterium]
MPVSPIPTPSISRDSLQGFETYVLRTAAIELILVPALGGRVVSLRDRRSGREWLWHRPEANWLWANRRGDNFGNSPQAGIDECLPSVAACQLDGRDIPDHGELWYQSWTVDESALARRELSIGADLETLPLRFRRSIVAVEDSVLEFRYQLENRGERAEPFLWCLHPLFTIREGDRIVLPAEVTTLRLNGGLGVPITFGDVWRYPEPFPGIALERLVCPGGEGACVKGFAGPLREGRAALVNDRTGDGLELQWDATQVPMLGLWLNRGLAGFHHVALEPTHGAPDSLADAVHLWKQHAVIAPGARMEWSVRWTLTAAARPL